MTKTSKRYPNVMATIKCRIHVLKVLNQVQDDPQSPRYNEIAGHARNDEVHESFCHFIVDITKV
jgi:hypothetical protein